VLSGSQSYAPFSRGLISPGSACSALTELPGAHPGGGGRMAKERAAPRVRRQPEAVAAAPELGRTVCPGALSPFLACCARQKRKRNGRKFSGPLPGHTRRGGPEKLTAFLAVEERRTRCNFQKKHNTPSSKPVGGGVPFRQGRPHHQVQDVRWEGVVGRREASRHCRPRPEKNAMPLWTAALTAELAWWLGTLVPGPGQPAGPGPQVEDRDIEG